MKNELSLLGRVLRAIKSNMEDFTVIGWFASFLYQFHPSTHTELVGRIYSKDIDLASEGNVPVRGKRLVHESLLLENLEPKAIGFRENNPPKIQYHPKDLETGYYLEFLTPLHGSGLTKKGKPDCIKEVQKGLFAEKLRYLDLLINNRWKLHSSAVPLPDPIPDLMIRIPHPALFIMQKTLISKDRRGDMRIKDFANIYQVLSCFRKTIPSIASEYEALIDNPLWKKWYKSFRRLTKENFEKPESDGALEASRALGPDFSSRMISAAVMEFLGYCPGLR